MMSRLKKILASLMAIGALSCLTVSETYALLSSQESNGGSSVSTGTLTLNNRVNSGTICLSYGGSATPGNVNNACDALFTSSTLNYPGAPITPATVTIENDGSLDATDLSLYVPSCAAGNTPGAPSPGAADPCGLNGAQFYVQETDAGGNPTQCRFPAAAGACTSVGSSLYVFDANYTSAASALDLGAGPAHGQSRYFQIGMRLPSEASNALQGRTASFGLTWHATS